MSGGLSRIDLPLPSIHSVHLVELVVELWDVWHRPQEQRLKHSFPRAGQPCITYCPSFGIVPGDLADPICDAGS